MFKLGSLESTYRASYLLAISQYMEGAGSRLLQGRCYGVTGAWFISTTPYGTNAQRCHWY